MTDLRTPPVSDGDLFSERVRQYAYERPVQKLSVLVAGCGWGESPKPDLAHIDVHVTGVDLDAPALRAHTEARSDLDTWHLGDLRNVPMPPRAYDIVCAPYLVERLTNTELVLDRIVAALKPGGLLLVRFRDRDTAFGFADRVIPVPLRRDEFAPPPAVYEKVASLEGMRHYCGLRGLVIAEEHLCRVAGAGPVAVLARLVAWATGGRLTASHSEVALVIRKPLNRFARVI